MKIINIIKFKKKYKLDFDSREPIFISENTLLNNNLIKKGEISEEKLLNILSDEKNEQAFSKGLNYLSYGLRTEQEIENYLIKNNFLGNQIQYAIEKLKKLDYINDIKFTDLYTKDSVTIKKKGPSYIKRKLLEKGIKESYIDSSILKICTYEIQCDNIYSIIKKEYLKNSESKNKKIQKITNKLYSNGYNFDIINSVFKIFFEDNIEENNDEIIIKKYYDKAYTKFSKNYEDKYILKQKILEKLLRDGFSYNDIKDYFSKIGI
ncbi:MULTISPECIES: RecX family transcriptional regulator [unclassified Gemella]|uniref:RecX family transcriptional regulator n=1 Tax=unclassified Gemella TaxID=2624949 RepID=UPI001C058B8F|nr:MULTISPECIES: RecX family transcriptional regulator [unclassified Gemella]MBU0278304.1 RecX family transcriptional regulator [Gemella sp. zg-1178]QWQ38190.1 RecX family transcriptional regulator [Gemella sp. zg-570]